MDISIVIEKVISILKTNVDECKDEILDGESALFNSGLLNSFTLVALLPEFESAFDISFNIDDLDIDMFSTPGSIARMILSLVK